MYQYMMDRPDGGSGDDGDEDEAREAEWVARQEVEDVLQEERVQLHLLQQQNT